MTSQSLFCALFGYKAQIEDELLEAMLRAEKTISADRFHPALETLYHLHLVDRIFSLNLQKMAQTHRRTWVNDPPPLAEVAAEMRTINRWYLNYVRELTSGELEEMIDFRFTDGSYGRMRREEMLAHVIVHSASHRGGIGALLPEIATTSERDVFAGYLHRTEPERRRKL